MGKGDRKTRRGKTYRGSYGKLRLHGKHSALATRPSVSANTKKTGAKKKAG